MEKKIHSASMKEEMRKRKEEEEEGKLTVYSYLKNKKKEMNNA